MIRVARPTGDPPGIVTAEQYSVAPITSGPMANSASPACSSGSRQPQNRRRPTNMRYSCSSSGWCRSCRIGSSQRTPRRALQRVPSTSSVAQLSRDSKCAAVRAHLSSFSASSPALTGGSPATAESSINALNALSAWFHHSSDPGTQDKALRVVFRLQQPRRRPKFRNNNQR